MKRNVWIALIAVGVSSGLTALSSWIIRNNFSNLPVAPDLFFTFIPFLPWMAYVADASVLVALAVLVWLAVTRKESASAIIWSMALMYSIRAMVNLFTPLAVPSGITTGYGFLEPFPALGMFPSGHTGLVVVALTWAYTFRGEMLKKFSWLALFSVVISLLSSRGHYSIDILGGIVLGWLSVEAIKRWMTMKAPTQS